MSFIEQRLLDRLAIGTQGGATWSTRQVPMSNGIVRRNAQRSRPLYRFAILYQNLLPEQHQAVRDAFNACRGGAYGFRLRDPSDFEATNEAFAVGTGSSQTVQLTKRYTFGTETVTRPIRKPNAGVVITANHAPISATVDTTTGLATFTAPDGHIVRWTGTFDVPVYFGADEQIWTFDRAAQSLVLSADMPLIEDLSA